ncbi:methylglyoxal synthase [Paenibacillus sp. V4I3]|uniref:methylglyoxal synthase n=1 Tax=unclassified Paenibacillus TaxID=185978 RepID=UPI00277E37BC|nr:MULTISPECIES: methylglyoxal synthase [unclassified Paenibacillus]MDQ0873972.1 methylglyoxal synthase [Paenibacillus sp. V4I3]MDQ0890153.1 methylglyoxal synthase [Paenibacillus sp. V4I9]
MNIALVAHDVHKNLIVDFVIAYRHIFQKHRLFATGTTGRRISEEAKLEVIRLRSGPFGGDQQIGAMIAMDDIDMLIFFRDPITALGHEPDITALLRLCDVQKIPLATNVATAEMLIKAMESGFLAWREEIRKYDTLRMNGTE